MQIGGAFLFASVVFLYAIISERRPSANVKARFKEFESQSWRDYALIPYWLARYAFAWVWTLAWYSVSRLHWWIRAHLPRLFLLTRYFLPLGGGRRVDPDPIMCPRCLWARMRRWAVHSYVGWGDGEVEACDYCPRCGGEV